MQAASFLPGQTEAGVWQVPAWLALRVGPVTPTLATEPCCPTCEMGQLFLQTLL